MTNKKQEDFSKTNPVGLKALSKLIVYGDSNLNVFTASERMFVDERINIKTSSQHKKSILDRFISLDILVLNSFYGLLAKKAGNK